MDAWTAKTWFPGIQGWKGINKYKALKVYNIYEIIEFIEQYNNIIRDSPWMVKISK